MTVWRQADVEGRLGRELAPNEAAVLDGSLGELIEGELSLFLHRPIEAATIIDEVHFIEGLEATIPLRNTPVLSVQTISLQDALSPPTFTTLDTTMYVANLYGVVIAWGAWLPDPADPTTWPLAMKVSYTAGLTDLIPGYAAIRSVLAARLARILSKAAQDLGEEVTQLSVEGYTVYLAADGWSDHEQTMLRGLRRKIVR